MNIDEVLSRITVENVSNIRGYLDMGLDPRNADWYPMLQELFTLNEGMNMESDIEDVVYNHIHEVLRSREFFEFIEYNNIGGINMLSKYETNPRKAKSVQEMRQVACNQIDARIYELEEHIKCLKNIKPLVESVRGWEDYERVIQDLDDDNDVDALTALHILGEEYITMVSGNYW